MIGLDISHAVEYTKLMQDPAIPADRRVGGMVVEKCLRFETPFQNQAGLDRRQQTLEQLGVAVGTDFDSVTADCDAVIMTINDHQNIWNSLKNAPHSANRFSSTSRLPIRLKMR